MKLIPERLTVEEFGEFVAELRASYRYTSLRHRIRRTVVYGWPYLS